MGTLPDDSMREILLRLPAKSVGRFRRVAKSWLSITSDPQFMAAHAAAAPFAGLFVRHPTLSSHADYFSSNGADQNQNQDPDPSLFFLHFNGLAPELLDSSNGLILCRLPKRYKNQPSLLSVSNPTTKHHDVIVFSQHRKHKPPFSDQSFALAFDPSRSPHFRIIALVTERDHDGQGEGGDGKHHMYKYFSESRSWKKLLQIVGLNSGAWNLSFYWNGWLFFGRQTGFVNQHQKTYVLDVDEERLIWDPLVPEPHGKMKILYMRGSESEGEPLTWHPLLPESHGRTNLWYIGESKGRLHVIRGEINDSFEILEMISESSGWKLIHTTRLYSTWYSRTLRNVDCLLSSYHRFFIGFIRGDKGGDHLLFRVPGRIVSHHLQPQLSRIISEVPSTGVYRIFPLVHTLFPS